MGVHAGASWRIRLLDLCGGGCDAAYAIITTETCSSSPTKPDGMHLFISIRLSFVKSRDPSTASVLDYGAFAVSHGRPI